MPFEALIPATEFCLHHQIEVSFLRSLHDYGLIEMTIENETAFLDPEQLNELEKLLRLHYELQVNMEGLDVVQHLLQRIDTLQREATLLKRRLQFYGEEV